VGARRLGRERALQALYQLENDAKLGSQGALDAAERGEIKLIFPTRRNLERLALFASFAEARAQAEAIPVRTIMPQVVEQDGKPWLTILADAGYPVTGELLETVARG